MINNLLVATGLISILALTGCVVEDPNNYDTYIKSDHNNDFDNKNKSQKTFKPENPLYLVKIESNKSEIAQSTDSEQSLTPDKTEEPNMEVLEQTLNKADPADLYVINNITISGSDSDSDSDSDSE